ncbi:MAG: hypothetical protein E6J13_14930 [Chloroflexi bacterium]|nr:MAG: hypothetical protein E6J13_14930 [Chloroflexota bacterium]
MRRLKWLTDFAIDYGSIALVVFVAAIFLWGAIEPAFVPQELPPEMSGITTLFGILLLALALKLWRDVRGERRRKS